MAKSKVSRSPVTTKPPAHKRARHRITPEMADRMHGELMGIKAAAITAILALESNGVNGEIATSLRMHVFWPLVEVAQKLDAAS